MGLARTVTSKIQAWAKARGALIGLIGLLSGTAIGIVTPLWQNYWVETPRLSVEIYAIERQVSPDARIPADDDALTVLVRAAQLVSFEERIAAVTEPASLAALRTARRGGYTPKEAADLLVRAKAEQKSLPERLEERQRQLRDIESLTAERITPSDVNRFNGPIAKEFRSTPLFTLPTAEGAAERQRAIDHFRAEYGKRLEEVQKRYAELQAQLPVAERRIDEMKKDLEDKKGFFQITVVLNNAGRKSISIRQLALLRVYIGKGNYVDLRLNLKDYEKNAQIDANGTRLAVFTSDLTEALPEADRSLVSTYWGQSVHGILFTEDIGGSIHASNRISFAKGLYIKEVFDRLTTEAASQKYIQALN